MTRTRRLLAALLCAALALTGCLAQPERAPKQGSQDRFIGLYVIGELPGGGNWARDAFYDNPNLTSYGTDDVTIPGAGEVSFDREVLFAEQNDAGDYFFPGMEGGYSLFLYNIEREWGHANAVQSNMAPGEDGGGTRIKVTDEGEENSISGTIYVGPPLGVGDDWNTWEHQQAQVIWTAYRVYQTPDGRVYTDGSGDSYGGPGFSVTTTESSTETVDGESRTCSLAVTLSIRESNRLETVTLRQFDEEDQLLRTDTVEAGQTGQDMEAVPLPLDPGAAYVLSTLSYADGTSSRELRNVEPGRTEPILLDFVFLDPAGRGYLASVELD